MRAVTAGGSRSAAPALAALATLAMLAAVAPGCGENVVVRAAPTAKQRGVAPPAGGTSNVDPLRTAAAAQSRLTITVDDTGPGTFAYHAPRHVRGGLVEIRLRNVGEVPHKAQLWRIAGDHTVGEALGRLKAGLPSHRPLPDWLFWAGGVSLTAPRATSVSLQDLRAGRYYVSATMDRPGSVASFEVAAPKAARQVPRAPARVEMRDYAFAVSGLRAGRNSVAVDNTGAQPHLAYFARMRAGAGLADVRRFFGEKTSIGRPPVDGEQTRETAVLEGGDRQVTQLDLPAGRYALVCFVRNRGGGPRHLELGMINEVTVR
ncbi:MAG: hypothetical protein QOJ35_2841 [Solirubrobacteraceae bacterium]|jgi:hypothetical protein|nr:hypothetical protein [Solirubrobacteraceae bacterium]